MEGKIWLRRAVVVMAAVALGAPALRADDAAAPGRAVRLNNVDGQVQVSQDGEVVADHALANTPLFQGSEVATGDDGRAEIQFDDGSVARIPPDSSVTLTVLKTGGETEISLDSGMAYFELQDGQGKPMRVRLGTNVVTVSGFTVLRAKLDDGPAELAVFSGNAHVDGTDGASVDVHGGQSLGMANMNVAESIEPDSWDAWNSDRDQAQTTADAGSTPANVPDSNNPAWGDLNSSGTWYDVPDQGYVWSPYEASNAGWAPWSEGYWMWTPRFGYIWVSQYSWGYLPYQCGLWNWYTGFGWGWLPGMCNDPWWGGGGGWIFNVGYMPTWYRLPVRPHPPRPINPRPLEPRHPVHHVPIFKHPVAPVIAVNRKDYSGTTPLPPRDPNQPVHIGSVIAQPVHPLPRTAGGPGTGVIHGGPITRPLNGPPTAGANPVPVPRPVYTPARPGYMPAPGYGSRPGYTPAPQPGGRTPGVGVTPPPRPSAPGGTYHAPSAPSAPRPSGGGGGSHPAPSGGGSHPAPSGGGGGSHPSSSPHK